jgi:hypothetical protein
MRGTDGEDDLGASLTCEDEVLILVLQIQLKFHQSPRSETMSTSSDTSADFMPIREQRAAYFDFCSHPLETVAARTSSAWDLRNGDFSSEVRASALVDPIELTG